MNSCLRTQRTCTLTALLFVLAYLIGGAANLFAQTGSLSGLVIRLDGSTMAGVEVRARPEEPNPAGLSAIVARTNASGQYRIDAIPAGTYVISAGPENGNEISLRTNLEMWFETLAVRTPSGTVERTARVTSTLTGPSRITLHGNSSSEFNILVVPSVVSVSGRLAIPAGFSLQPMRASLTRVQNSASVPAGDAPALPQILAETGIIRLIISDFRTEIDVQSDGTFHFPQIPPGEYVLRWIPNLGVPTASIVVANENITDIAPVGQSSGVRVGGNAAKSDKPSYQDKFPDWIYLIPRSARDLQSISRTQLV